MGALTEYLFSGAFQGGREIPISWSSLVRRALMIFRRLRQLDLTE